MNNRKLLGLVLLAAIFAAIPAAYAAPKIDKKSLTITLDEVTVYDRNGDGVKDSAHVDGTAIVTKPGAPVTGKAVIVYYLEYTTDPSVRPRSWVFYTSDHEFTSSPDGATNSFDLEIVWLPYPGWYKVKAVAYFKGDVAVSNWIAFDPPGGGEDGPLGGY
jgi:hypothetical protein